MSWPLVKVEDAPIKISDGNYSGKYPKASEFLDSGIPFLSGYNIVNGVVDEKNCKFISEKLHGELKKGHVETGDVLITTRGNIGNTAIVPARLNDVNINAQLVLLRPDKGQIDSNYLKHIFNSPDLKRQISIGLTGSALKQLPIRSLKELEVPLPPLDEQKRIASILDKADAIRLKRQQAINLADDFLRSVFLDMFGDPVKNPKGFPLSILSDFYIDHKNGTKCGPFGSALKKHEYVEDGVPVWNMDNISLNGKFTDSPRLWISESKYADLEAYSVQNGDVIISRAGTVGKMGVVRSQSEHSIISTNLIRVRFGEKLRPEYFVNLMNYCKGRVGRLKTGPDGAFTHMNTGILDKLEFPYPAIDLQDRFIEIKEKVISSLEKSEKKEIDNLFNSLSQKAFAGEL